MRSPSEKYAGDPTCIKLFGRYLFIGNSMGYIRVFDLLSKDEKVKDCKPLYDKSLAKNPVMCMDLSQGMKFLAAGYQSGTVALFDIQTYKLVKIMKEAHATEVLSVQIQSVV